MLKSVFVIVLCGVVRLIFCLLWFFVWLFVFVVVVVWLCVLLFVVVLFVCVMLCVCCWMMWWFVVCVVWLCVWCDDCVRFLCVLLCCCVVVCDVCEWYDCVWWVRVCVWVLVMCGWCVGDGMVLYDVMIVVSVKVLKMVCVDVLWWFGVSVMDVGGVVMNVVLYGVWMLVYEFCWLGEKYFEVWWWRSEWLWGFVRRDANANRTRTLLMCVCEYWWWCGVVMMNVMKDGDWWWGVSGDWMCRYSLWRCRLTRRRFSWRRRSVRCVSTNGFCGGWLWKSVLWGDWMIIRCMIWGIWMWCRVMMGGSCFEGFERCGGVTRLIFSSTESSAIDDICVSCLWNMCLFCGWWLKFSYFCFICCGWCCMMIKLLVLVDVWAARSE